MQFLKEIYLNIKTCEKTLSIQTSLICFSVLFYTKKGLTPGYLYPYPRGKQSFYPGL